MDQHVFVRPSDGWVGDVIPFVEGGCAQLYYLHDARSSDRPGMPWHCYETTDFATYRECGEAIPSGGASAPDLNIYTGSVVESGGVRHAFYTGFNEAFHEPGEPARQLVMHASRAAGDSAWAKHPEDTFGAPDGYESVDFRDPFVFRPDESGPWLLLVIARRAQGADRRRGVILQYVSQDLSKWEFDGEFWAPDRYVAIECPEVFQLGGNWYLVYSEFSDRFATHYRVGPTAHGPWTTPLRDTVDGRAFYAAKSMELDGSRYFAGWIPTRAGDSDNGAWEWAGSLAVHLARPLPDGSLAFSLPPALRESFTRVGIAELAPVIGDWQDGPGQLSTSVPDGAAVAVTTDVPDQYLFEATIETTSDTVECGIILRASADGSEGYLLRIEPRHDRLVFDRWPRQRTGPAQWQISGDVPFAVELERPLRPSGGRYQLQVVVDATCCTTYVNDEVVMSARMYDRRTGGVGLFVGDGSARFTNVSIATR